MGGGGAKRIRSDACLAYTFVFNIEAELTNNYLDYHSLTCGKIVAGIF